MFARSLIVIMMSCLVFWIGSADAATYYVKPNGNDNANGLTWANAWSTLNKVNTSVGRGDTVFFGTGIWRGELKIQPGYANDRTVYACSSFALTNGSGQYHFAKIYGSQPVTNWIQHSGNIYKARYTACDGGLLCQGDSLFWLQSGISSLTQPGRFYVTGDTIYAYVYNIGNRGYDPDNYAMEAAAAPIIWVNSGHGHSEGADYVTLWGLELKYAAVQIIRLENPLPTHFYVDHCKLSHIASLDFLTNNPACIYSANQDPHYSSYSRALACSIGYSICHGGSDHGTGITLYCAQNFTVDSCTFFGYFSANCINFKRSVKYSVVKNSIFNPTNAQVAVEFKADAQYDSAYFNVAMGNINNGFIAYSDFPSIYPNSNYLYCLFNTVVGDIPLIGAYTSTCGGHKAYDTFTKYNVYYLSSVGYYSHRLLECESDPAYRVTIDSNLYCLVDSTRFYIGTSRYNLASWRNTFRYDTRTTLVNSLAALNFVNYPYDLRRNISVPEVTGITIGGVQCSRYGAFQGPVAPDSTPPVISSVTATGINYNGATILWGTNEPANSTVNYGLTTAYGQSAGDAAYVYAHQVTLNGLLPDTIYHFRVRSRDGAGNESVSGDYSFRTDTVTTYQNLALGITPTVSSTYSGYTIGPINNGVIAPRGGTATTWASTSNLTIPHWVEFNFGSARQLSSVRIYWAWNGTSSSWMCSRQYHLQYWNNSTSSFENITTVNNAVAESVTTTTFEPRVTTRFRYYQPAGMGPATYPSVVWLTELEIYGIVAPQDTIPPAPVRNFEARPGGDRGSIDLFWEAPGGDDTIGQAAAYIVRYMADAGQPFDWDQATETADLPPLPEIAGTPQTFTISGLEAGMVYQVAVRAVDDMGNVSPLSEIADTFACGIAPPSPVQTEVDSTAQSVLMTASRVESYLSLFYEFALDSLAGFPAPELRQDFAADSLPRAIYTGLSPGKVYFWRCRAGSNQTADYSSWSQTVSFSLDQGPIAPPILTQANCLYPGTGETVITSRPTFSVNYPGDVFEVYIQIDNEDSFDQPIESGPLIVADSQIIRWRVPNDLLDRQTYYWRVSSDNANWSSPVQFATEFAVHAYPNPFRPAAGHSGIIFTSLPENAEITITTISGNPVKTASPVGPGEWIWDVKDNHSEDIAAGVYLYSIDFSGGSTSGKLVIIK